LSTTSATTLFSGLRSSFKRTGLSRATVSAAMASRRSTEPRRRIQSPTSANATTGTSTSARSGRERSGSKLIDQFTGLLLLAQPFEQYGHVHLVGLVVARQHVHHDVDAGAIGIDALRRIGRHRRQERLAVGVDRPGAGEVVGR